MEKTDIPTMNRPKWILVWTVLAIVVIGIVTFFAGKLNEQLGWQPGWMNAARLLMIFVTVFAWLFWVAFFSGHRFRYLIALVLFSTIALFFYRFRMVFDGDFGFVRFESRFVERIFDVVQNELRPEGVNLRTTSPNDFNQFLGNERIGVVGERVLNTDWTNNPPEIIWKKSVGDGWSGFSAVNGYAVTQEQRGQDECVTCYEIESGDLMWIYSAARRHEDTMAMGKAGPRATPTIHQGRVYAQGATGVLDCLDGTYGTVIWSVDIPKLLGTEMTVATSSRGFEYQFENKKQSSLLWGRSGSPLIYKDTVIVTGGVTKDGTKNTLIAFNKNDGTEIWRGGDRMIAYGSPSVANLLGQPQITLVAENAGMGFDPDTGKVLWDSPRPGNSDGDANCSQVTRIADDIVLLSKGYGVGGELVRLVPGKGGISAESIWRDARALRTKMMSPLILGQYAYSLSDGFLECTKISEEDDPGKRTWRKRGRFGNGQMLLIGKHLLVHTEYGKLKLIEATPDKYNELGEIATIGGICWNTICLYDNYLLVRSELEAACIRLKLDKQGPAAEERNSETIVPDQGEQADKMKDDSGTNE